VALKSLILQCCETEELGFYIDVLTDLGVRHDIVHAYREPIPAMTDYDLLMVGGTPDAAYHRAEFPYLSAVYDVICRAVRADKACFGICCGAQLLAVALGGEARPSPVMEIGVTELELTDAGHMGPILRGFPDRFPAFQWHADTFDVPPGADLLVTGEASRNQMFRKGRAVGVMFHLEVSAGAAGRYARAYADELRGVGKTEEEVVAECRAREGEMRELGRRLVKGLLTLGASRDNGKGYYRGRLASVREKLGHLAEHGYIRTAMTEERLDRIEKRIETWEVSKLNTGHWPGIYLFIADRGADRLRALEEDVKLVLRSTTARKSSQVVHFMQVDGEEGSIWKSGVFELYAKSAALKSSAPKVNLDYDLPNGRDVDIMIELGERGFHLECTTLTDSKKDTKEWNQLLQE
jgi:GMP synthase (glutamine-hydrolysing)